MIDFNVPPYIGTEMKYIEEAVAKNHKICGDGRLPNAAMSGWRRRPERQKPF